jgi:hypothetical protein
MADIRANTLSGDSVSQESFKEILRSESSGICDEGKSSPNTGEIHVNIRKNDKIKDIIALIIGIFMLKYTYLKLFA